MNAFSPSSDVSFTKSDTVVQFEGDKSASTDSAPSETTLMVQHMTYTVKEMVGPWWKGGCFRPIRKKVVLDDINMIFKSGQFTAVVGGSGSGKTSLLDVISYHRDGHVRGHILYNGQETSEELMHHYGSYVMQADRLLPNLTVRETLIFTSRLRLPGNVRHWDILSRVQKVITEMGLKHVGDSRIGGTVVRGISGGEKRRVTIAIQLLQDPHILLLDEPTTGLDSYTARYLVRNLADIAHRGKIVIITIHQPRSDLFNLFDQIVLLSEGRQVYSGPRSQMVQYFTDLGYPCPKYVNPMDYFVDLASVDRRNEQKEKRTRSQVSGFIESFQTSGMYTNMAESFSSTQRKYYAWLQIQNDGPGVFRKLTTLGCPLGEKAQWSLGITCWNYMLQEFETVYDAMHHLRMTLNLYRDKSSFISRFLLLPFYFVFIILFLGRLSDNQESIQDRVGLLYQISTVPPYVGIVLSTAVFPSLREVYYRESRDGLYGAGLFILSYAIHILPFQITSSLIFGSSIYWICGMLPGIDRFLTCLAVLFILYYVTEVVNTGFMGIFNNCQVASSLCVLCLSASVTFASGFLRNVQSMLSGLQFASWFFIHKYASEILSVNEYNGLNFTCSADVPCLFKDGKEYLDVYYPGAIDHMHRNFYALAGYTIVTFLVSILAYKVRGTPNLR